MVTTERIFVNIAFVYLHYDNMADNLCIVDKPFYKVCHQIYCPKRCVIVPKSVNDLIVVPTTTDLPVGISKINNRRGAKTKYATARGFSWLTYEYAKEFMK